MAETQHFKSADDTRLAWHERGAGRPLLLIHGYISNAHMNWIKFGHADAIAAAGFRVIMPDLRGHGDSDRPHDPAAYSRDVLSDDGFALLGHLGIEDYDLGGYSLGARTAVRMIARGAAPRRLVLAGMGLDALVDAERRSAHFRRIFANLGSFERFSPAWNVEAFLKTTGGDPVALDLLLDSFASTDAGAIGAITQPTLVVAGVEDDDNGSHAELAAALPHATLVEVPGGHMSAVTKPELGRAIAAFLAESGGE